MQITQTDAENMEAIALQLVLNIGIPLALSVMKNMKGATTIDQAIAALEKTVTSQEYVDADAAKRGITAKPLPTS